jgi:hypothetical protein
LWFGWFGVTENGQRRSWRLVLRLPDDYAEDTAALFRWLREYVIPACLNAPVAVTLEFVPPDDVPPDQPSS